MEGLIPVLDAAQRRSCDELTRNSEPISGTELMERASWSMSRALLAKYRSHNYHFLCGPGNNGGDGLAMARILAGKGCKVRVSHFIPGKNCSAENAKNAALFQKVKPRNYEVIHSASDLMFSEDELMVDALLGSGLKESLRPEIRSIVERLSASRNAIVAIDIPSGMFCSGEQKTEYHMRAEDVFCVQFPPISFFYPENKIEFTICDAGIKPTASESWFLSPQEPWSTQLLSALPPKTPFSHKGDHGHVLLIGGNNGMHGAITLSAAACLELEPGNLTVMGPPGLAPYLALIPRAMHRNIDFMGTSLTTTDLSKFSVAAIGPGLDKDKNAADFIESFLKKWDRPLLLDADALNLIAADKDLWKYVKPESIITPHPKEFERLFGKCNSGEALFKKAAVESEKLGIYILLKGRYSVLFCPDGQRYFNGSGHPGLARGGSGDELTGRIAGIWARTKDAKTAAMLGMYISGLKA